MTDYSDTYTLHDGETMSVLQMKDEIHRLRRAAAPFDFTRTDQDVDGGEAEVVYHPWGNGSVVGFEVVHRPTGKVEYIYLNPSDNFKGDDTPNVFLYHGDRGDPAYDGSHHFYPVLEEHYEVSDSNPYNITLDEHDALHAAEGSYLKFVGEDHYSDETGNDLFDAQMIARLVEKKMLKWDIDEPDWLVITDTGVMAHDKF